MLLHERILTGLEETTIFCFGQITDRSRQRIGRLEPKSIRELAAELRRRYPKMAGVAFFQSTDEDTPELRNLIRSCDRLSAELWLD